MKMKILDGKMVSSSILSETKDRIKLHIDKSEESLGYVIKKPNMAIIIVGSNQASETYVKAKMRACDSAGIDSYLIRFEDRKSVV